MIKLKQEYVIYLKEEMLYILRNMHMANAVAHPIYAPTLYSIVQTAKLSVTFDVKM